MRVYVYEDHQDFLRANTFRRDDGTYIVEGRRCLLQLNYPAWRPVRQWNEWTNGYVTILGRSVPLWINLS